MEKNLVQIITKAMLDKKAKEVISLDLRGIDTAITDDFIICNADSTTAVASIADNVLVKMKELADRKVIRMQGLENNFWIILDFGEVVVHIFLTEYRDFYKLEELWADAPRHEYTDEAVASIASEEVKSVKPKAVSKLRASAKRKTKVGE